MRFFKSLILLLSLTLSVGCASQDCSEKEIGVLSGTKTAVVKLYVDKKGYPQTKTEVVTVSPGQKILFAGPDRFDILFKNQLSPIEKLEVRSKDGVVVIEIPKDIFERARKTSPNTASANELIYKYGIRIGDKVTDPTIRIVPEDKAR